MAKQTHAATTPRELDIDLNRMRADKLLELRLIMRDLDDLDAVERVLNGTHAIAVSARVAAARNGSNGHQRLLEAAHERLQGETPDELDEEPPAKRKTKGRRFGGVPANAVRDHIMKSLSKSQAPVQAGAMLQTFPGQAPSQANFNRILKLMIRDNEIVRHDEGRYPVYALAAAAPSPRVGVRTGTKRGPYQKRKKGSRQGGSGMHPNPLGVGAGSMRVLAADTSEPGLTIHEIAAVLDAEGTTKFLTTATHATQISWAMKGHIKQGRVKTTKKGGETYFRAVRPKISVTKSEPE